MSREDIEQDLAKDEQSTNLQIITRKHSEDAETSAELGRTKQEIGKDESSTEPVSTEEDTGKGEISIELTKIGKGVDLAETSTMPRKIEFIGSGETSPKLLRKGDGSCCIFRIPRGLANIHNKGREPEIVSIGPYHHKKDHLKMIAEHKNRFLQLFLAEATNVGVDDLLEEISSKEEIIRNSYSETLVEVNKQTLVNMMLIDGCFILMLFFFVTRKVLVSEKSPHDPILTTPWILATIRSDLLLLENQVPLILLETLFKSSKFCSLGLGGLNRLAVKFFGLSMVKAVEYWTQHNNLKEDLKEEELKEEELKEEEEYWTQINNLKAEHLLDLIRQTFIPISSKNTSDNPRDTPQKSQSFMRLILSAKRLRLQGIEFKASLDHTNSNKCCEKVFCYCSNESPAFVVRSPSDKKILEIQLKGNELIIPPIVFDELISSVLVNCVAFEQLFSKCSNDITNYVVFMGCLMNDEVDAIYLIEKGIIENYFGNGNDVSQFFRNIRNGITFDLSKSYLKPVFEDINKYTSRKCKVELSRFKHLHFDSPWTCMSSSAVLAILLLTIFQATMAGLSYFRPPHQPSDKGT